MSLLESVVKVAEECGYAVSSTVVGSSDTTTKSLYRIANRVINNMLDAYPWRKLWKSTSITLADGVSTYALPGDFNFYAFDTWWDQSQQWKVYGPMSPQEYADIRGFDLDSLIYNRFAIRGVTNKQILFSPTPGASIAGHVIIYEYFSRRPVRPRTWTASLVTTAGSYIFYDGNYYTTTAGGTTGATPPTHTSGSVSDGVVTWTYYSGAYEMFLADTDEPILSPRILEQGMMERFAALKELNVLQSFDRDLLNEFSKEIPGEMVDASGRGRSGRMAFGQNGRVVFGT